jgi:hypothetical protein
MPIRRGVIPAPPRRAGLVDEEEVVTTSLSFPVAFQYPASVARFVLIPVGYLRSLRLKKYHSFSPIFAFSAHQRYVSLSLISCIGTRGSSSEPSCFLHYNVINLLFERQLLLQSVQQWIDLDIDARYNIRSRLQSICLNSCQNCVRSLLYWIL